MSKEIKSQRKQEAKLWNPLFITEVAGLYGTFVQIRERCFLRAGIGTQVHGLINDLWTGPWFLLSALGMVHKRPIGCDGFGLVVYEGLTQEHRLP